MTASISSILLILLLPNVVRWYITICQSVLCKDSFTVSKVKSFVAILSMVMLSFCVTNVAATVRAHTVNIIIYYCFYYISRTADPNPFATTCFSEQYWVMQPDRNVMHIMFTFYNW